MPIYVEMPSRSVLRRVISKQKYEAFVLGEEEPEIISWWTLPLKLGMSYSLDKNWLDSSIYAH